MKKNMLIFGILAISMLVTISFASAVTTNTQTMEKESPLYTIRAKRAIIEQIGEIKEKIKTNFIGNRLLWIPLLKVQNDDVLPRDQFAGKRDDTSFGQHTCFGGSCTVTSPTCAYTGCAVTLPTYANCNND